MAAAAGDAHPVMIHGSRHRMVFPILDADGDLVTGASALDSEFSEDQATFADCTNEATEIATSSGVYFLDLVDTETQGNCVAVIVKSTEGKTTPLVFYPHRLHVVITGTAQGAGVGNNQIQLASGENAFDDSVNGLWIRCSNNSPAGVLGQTRAISDYNGSTKTVTVSSDWGTNPSSATTYEIGYLVATNAAAISGNEQTSLDARKFWDDGFNPTTNQILSVLGSNVIASGSFAVNAITATAIADGAIDAATFAAGAIDAASTSADFLTEVRDSITGGAYALDTDANGRIRSVDGTGAGEIDTASGRVQITEAQIDQIVNEVWDEAQADHVAAGSFGIIASEIADILVDTAELGAAVGVSLSADIAAVKAETALIVADTNELQTDWVNGGRLDVIIDAILADTGTDGVVLANDAITAAKIAADAIGASEFAADAANKIADALLDRTNGIETSVTLRQSLRAILSAAVGKLSGAATTTVSIRDTPDTKNRIVATVDADGNRSAVTLTLT